MTVVRRISEGIGKVSATIAEYDKWLIIVVILATTYEVFMRYVLNAPTSWAWATTQMLGAAFISLGLANNHRINANVRVDILSMRFSPRWRAIIEVLFTVLFLFPLAFVLARLFVEDAFFALSINQVDNTCAWSPITWPYKMVIAAAMVLLFAQGIGTFLKDIAILRRGSEQPW